MSDISSLEKQAAELGRSLDRWNKVYVWSLAVALLAGLITFLAQRQTISGSRKLGRVNADIAQVKDENLQRDLKAKDDQISKTNERAAGLEKEAAEARLKLEEVRKKQERRTFDSQKFMEALSGKPRCDVEIVYQPDDSEAYTLAKLIFLYLGVVRFNVDFPFRPIPPDMGVKSVYLGQDGNPLPPAAQDTLREMDRALPPTVRAGAIGDLNKVATQSGIFIASNKEFKPPLDLNIPFGAVVNAFIVSGLVPNAGFVPDLPDNKLRIIVGPRP